MARDDLGPECLIIADSKDVIKARRRGLELATQMGFPVPEATKIAVVISELGRNIILYARKGTITLMPRMGQRKYIKIVAQDEGPGIENVDLVLKGGYTTSNGMGLGISGSKRMMDEFNVETKIGAGTTITALKNLH